VSLLCYGFLFIGTRYSSLNITMTLPQTRCLSKLQTTYRIHNLVLVLSLSSVTCRRFGPLRGWVGVRPTTNQRRATLRCVAGTRHKMLTSRMTDYRWERRHHAHASGEYHWFRVHVWYLRGSVARVSQTLAVSIQYKNSSIRVCCNKIR